MRVHVWPSRLHGPSLLVTRPRDRRRRLVTEALGVLSVLVSIGLVCVALDIFASYLSTDFFVPDFSATLHVLVTALNHQLALGGTGALDLMSPHTAYLASLPRAPSPAYARLLMYDELTTVESAVRGIRQLASSRVVKMVSPYCWVDLQKRWELAYTVQRQARCWRWDATNGAVHLETVLRNVQWKSFLASTQGRFLSTIGAPIAESSADGATWLAALQTHQWVPEGDEVALWQRHGIDRFTLQYGTGYDIGISETIEIVNALGQRLLLPLKAKPTLNRWAFRTTNVLYNLLYNDLYAIGTNQSLVRGTRRYFGEIDPNQIETYCQGYPLRPLQQVLHDGIGPLGNIDIKWVPAPRSLIRAVSLFHAALTAQLLASAFEKLGRTTLYPTPLRWMNMNLRFITGNPMCTFGGPMSFVQQTLGFDDVCGAQAPLTLEWHAYNALFALAMYPTHASTACAPFVEPGACQRLLADALALRDTLQIETPPASWIDDVAAYNVGLFQMLVRHTSAIELDLQPLLSPDFEFLGAMYLYDWAHNEREVVQIQGDAASFTLMSSLYLPLPRSHDDAAAPKSLGPYLCFLAMVTSATLAITGGLLLCVGWRTRSAISHDWWSFGPLTASVWVSRNLLVLRSVAAILCLATVPISTTTTMNGFVRLVEGPRSIWVSCILALESLWLMLVAHNVLLPLQRTTANTSPLHAVFGWCGILALDQLAPPTLSASLDRRCDSVNMDSMVYCTSGTVHVGSISRVLIVLSIAAFFICTSLIMALCPWSSRAETPRPNAILPLLSPWRVTPGGHAVSATAAVMCGLLPLRWRGRRYLFDVKLWLLLRADDRVFDDGADGDIVLPFSATPSATSQESGSLTLKHSSWERLLRVAGVAYIGLTLWSNAAYLGVLQNSLANDLGWAGFNATGMHAFLANTFNAQLLTAVDAPVFLHDASVADPLQPYNSSSTTVAGYPTMARRYLLSTAPPLDDLVAGLRSMDPCQLPWMFTQYCWLDMDQRWEMASTHVRQARCGKSAANGALYLETSLRNVRDWARWRRCWGDSFDIGFRRYLESSTAGRLWLDEVLVAPPQALSVSDEVAYWRAHGITQFVLQWQNFKDTGLDDAMVISSALGLSYTLPISQRAGAMHLDRQTSHRFYWALASDLWAINSNTTRIGGRSLLRQSPDFAFANATRASLLFENLTLSFPLSGGLHLLNASIGPFGAVDMLYISCPRSLLDFYDAVRRSIATETTKNLQAQRQLLALPKKPYIGHVPMSLLNDPEVGIVGGDLTCGNDIQVSPPSGALYALFGADSLCSWWHLEYFTPSKLGLIVALTGFDAVHSMQPDTDLDAFCARDVYAEAACVAIYNASYTLATSSLCRLTASLRSLATTAESDARALGIQTIQYLVKPYNSSNIALFQVNILDESDRSWVFFGWNYLAEWVVGLREVVSFQGDAGTITTISKQSKPMTLAIDDAGIPTRLSFVCQQCVRYVTGTIMLGAAVAALYALFVCRGAYEGANLFALNRLVGHAWVGRALLIVRGVTALWLLNTQPLELTAVGAGARFVAPPLAVVPTLLGASELSWLVYIMNDVLSCVTRQYTPFYAWKSSVAASAVAAVWTWAVPQDYTAYVRRRCTFVDMDLALTCTSGHVEIGRVSRISIDVALCVSCVVGAAVVERLLRPTLPSSRITSLFLNATSLYSSNLSYWAIGDEQYTDRMSAAMGGLFTWRYRGDMHVFDIKSWRHFVVAPETMCPFPASAVLPLHRIR